MGGPGTHTQVAGRESKWRTSAHPIRSWQFPAGQSRVGGQHSSKRGNSVTPCECLKDTVHYIHSSGKSVGHMCPRSPTTDRDKTHLAKKKKTVNQVQFTSRRHPCANLWPCSLWHEDLAYPCRMCFQCRDPSHGTMVPLAHWSVHKTHGCDREPLQQRRRGRVPRTARPYPYAKQGKIARVAGGGSCLAQMLGILPQRRTLMVCTVFWRLSRVYKSALLLQSHGRATAVPLAHFRVELSSLPRPRQSRDVARARGWCGELMGY